jgi:hypothetical protein
VKRALDLDWTHEEIYRMTGIDPWFLDQIQQIVDLEQAIRPGLDDETLREAKRLGFADVRIGQLTGGTELEVRDRRKAAGIVPVYKRVDTCAAEFVSHTPYLYSTYETGFEEHVGGGLQVEDEARPTGKKKIVILGGGVAGMSAAHELSERGFPVSVYEKMAHPGGKARSIPVPDSGGNGAVQNFGEVRYSALTHAVVQVLCKSSLPNDASPHLSQVRSFWLVIDL